MSLSITEILNQMREYMDLRTTMAESSKRKYQKIIRLFLLRTGLKFGLDDMNRFIKNSNKGKNCYNYKYAFKPFLSSIGKPKLYDDLTGVKRKPRKKVFKYISKLQLQKMINMLPNKFRYMALLQYKTGTRFQEVATIRVENIDFDISKRLIYIRIGVNMSMTKGSKERKIRISKKYEKIVRNLITSPFGYLFLKRDFEKYDENKLLTSLETFKRSYNDNLNRIGHTYNIDGFSSHYLRHLFADEFMLAGGKVENLQKIMGHAKIETTMEYVSIGDEMADQILLKMEGEEYDEENRYIN